MNSFKSKLIIFTLILLNSIVFSSITASADGTSGGYCGGGWTIIDMVILFVFIAALVLILVYGMKLLSSD